MTTECSHAIKDRKSRTHSKYNHESHSNSSSAIAELQDIYQAITTRMALVTLRVQAAPHEYCGFNQSKLDAVTDEMQQFSARLSAMPSTKLSVAKLKAEALMCLLPDDGDPATLLAESLCRDLVNMRLADTPNGTDIK